VKFERLKDTIYLLELGLLTFIAIAIYSFDSNDPGYSSVGNVEAIYNIDVIANQAGFIGAYIADFMLYYLGIAVYCMIIFWLISFSVRVVFYNYKSLFASSLMDMLVMLTFFPVMLISLCAMIAYIMPYSDIIWLPYGPGGVIGSNIMMICKSIFGPIGGQIVLLFALTLSVTLLLNMSFFKLVAKIIDGIKLSCHNLYTYTVSKINNPRQATKTNAAKSKERVSSSDIELNAKASKRDAIPFSFDNRLTNKDSIIKPIPEAKIATNKEHSKQNSTEQLDDNYKAINPLDLNPQQIKRLMDNKGNKQTKEEYIKATEHAKNVAPDIKLNLNPETKSIATKQPTTFKNRAIDNAVVLEYGALPNSHLLAQPQQNSVETERDIQEINQQLGEELIATLAQYQIKAEVVDVIIGPVVTRFEIQPEAGIKSNRITNLSQDIARSMTVSKVRVVEVIEGKSTIGIEIPNRQRKTVFIRDIIESAEYQKSTAPLTMALGHDIAGNTVTVDLAKTPHLLVAGTTGSGKSVAINTMIISLLYRNNPKDLRMIMIDPKMLELSVYEDIPHLLTPVVTDMNLAANALLWSVAEMERRYKLMAHFGVRNMVGFNQMLQVAKANGDKVFDPTWESNTDSTSEPSELQPLPYIVIIIDEFADMMMIVGKKVEQLIARIAQKARAAGIHLILATQRPSVDVITGLIKSNIPSRIAFKVSSKIDSRTIIDQGGAEELLGNGDMLNMPSGSSTPTRVHGALITDDEVRAVADFVRAQGEPNYIDNICIEETAPEVPIPGFEAKAANNDEELVDQIVDFVLRTRKSSISAIQRQFSIGYNRAAKIVDKLEEMGIVSAPAANGSRNVLPPKPSDGI